MTKIWQRKRIAWFVFLTGHKWNESGGPVKPPGNWNGLASPKYADSNFKERVWLSKKFKNGWQVKTRFMLKNYFKIAIAVLRRRKFFTFISLFGISFSLTILIIITAFIDNEISATYPDTSRDSSLYINNVALKNTEKNNNWNGSGSFYFLDHYTRLLKTPAKIAISSFSNATNTYINNKKLVINIKFTNAAYWDVLNYSFLEGKPYTQQQIDNAERVAVISEETKKAYFGDVPTVVGKYIEADNVQYHITGVVKNVAVTNMYVFADMYLPYTVSKANYRDESFVGNYTGILLPDSKSDLPKIKEEFSQIVSRIHLPKDWNLLAVHADGYLESFTREAFGGKTKTDSGYMTFILVSVVFVLLFLLLPTLNLVNINTSRIMERASEIGVRKAFGASSATLVLQFIVENIILTLLGGLIAIVLSIIILKIINNSDLLPNAVLSINITVVTYAVITCLLFGFLSGVYPAWRMSRLEAVDALKQV
jgi:putative ABC transport system permease protein